jgi:hypothetical protein
VLVFWYVDSSIPFCDAYDTLKVWRATIMWSHNMIIRLVPIGLYIAYYGLSFLALVPRMEAYGFQGLCVASWVFKAQSGRHFEGASLKEMISLAQPACETLGLIEFAMSSAISSICTVLIIVALFSMERKAYGGTIGFFLESALPFSFLGVVSAMVSMTCSDSTDQTFYREAVASHNMTVVVWTNSLVGSHFNYLVSNYPS